MIRKKDLAEELAKTRKELSNLRLDISIAFAHVSNRKDVDGMSNGELLQAVFDALNRQAEL